MTGPKHISVSKRPNDAAARRPKNVTGVAEVCLKLSTIVTLFSQNRLTHIRRCRNYDETGLSSPIKYHVQFNPKQNKTKFINLMKYKIWRIQVSFRNRDEFSNLKVSRKSSKFVCNNSRNGWNLHEFAAKNRCLAKWRKMVKPERIWVSFGIG